MLLKQCKLSVAITVILIGLASCHKTEEEKLNNELSNLFDQEFKADEPGGAVLLMKGEKIIFSKGYFLF